MLVEERGSGMLVREGSSSSNNKRCGVFCGIRSSAFLSGVTANENGQNGWHARQRGYVLAQSSQAKGNCFSFKSANAEEYYGFVLCLASEPPCDLGGQCVEYVDGVGQPMESKEKLGGWRLELKASKGNVTCELKRSILDHLDGA